jgi:hypothetical protein
VRDPIVFFDERRSNAARGRDDLNQVAKLRVFVHEAHDVASRALRIRWAFARVA